jgi:hypothetical protein
VQSDWSNGFDSIPDPTLFKPFSGHVLTVRCASTQVDNNLSLVEYELVAVTDAF